MAYTVFHIALSLIAKSLAAAKRKPPISFDIRHTTVPGENIILEATATSKGRIVIPSSIRRKFGIKEGTRIQIEIDEKANHTILKPITREYVHSLWGKLRSKGLVKALMAEKV
ncbi:MAG: AbrB/MazE/SpoVT family DNA-binding domain-containing protein [Blastocatellia bacterium]|nr:AbrB/MazE/SpoVT family DNA-binding domain-containing protein [Blastocatellia bacterium]